MLSENVKIKIKEVDNTTAASRPNDSTDIAFVPGFSTLETAPQNVPTLCSSVKEFETLFGATPRVLTYDDVAGYTQYGFKAGDVDRGYVFAKELVYAGIPVIYSNLNPDLAKLNVSEDSTVTDVTAILSAGSDSSFTIMPWDNTVGGVQLNMKDLVDNTDVVVFTFTVNVPNAKDNKTQGIYTFNIHADAVNATIESCEINVVSQENISATVVSDSCIELFNSNIGDAETTTSVQVVYKVSFVSEMAEAGDTAKITISKPSTSVLDAFYAADPSINTQLEMVADKSIYSVKYITSGGYPSVVSEANATTAVAKFASDMVTAAKTRGDAVALIDYMRCETLKPFTTTTSNDDSFYKRMATACASIDTAGFATAMYPWGIYSCPACSIGALDMPASYGYLQALAKAIKRSPNWMAMAGVTRGLIPGLQSILTPNGVLSNSDAENMQPKYNTEGNSISINCITNIRPYGLTLWGNRTLKPIDESAVALNFLNIRNMISDIKKLLYTSAKSLMFEQNTDALWARFKAKLMPTMNSLVSGGALSDFKIIKSATRYDGSPLTKGELAATIRIFPTYAIEYFELTVEINDQDVTVS